MVQNAASILGTDLRKSISIKNTGEGSAYLTLDVTSTPIAPPETIAAGFSIEKTLYTLDGEAVTTGKLKKGDRAIIHLNAISKFTSDKMIVMADLLPAGLEIETVLNPSDAEKTGRFPFLKGLSEFDLSLIHI